MLHEGAGIGRVAGKNILSDSNCDLCDPVATVLPGVRRASTPVVAARLQQLRRTRVSARDREGLHGRTDDYGLYCESALGSHRGRCRWSIPRLRADPRREDHPRSSDGSFTGLRVCGVDVAGQCGEGRVRAGRHRLQRSGSDGEQRATKTPTPVSRSRVAVHAHSPAMSQ